MDNKICISVVVNRNYEKYIPYFIYFITKSYPQYYIKILFLESLSKKTKELINLINNPLVSIEENFFKGFPKDNQQLKSIRWITPKDVFSNFDYVYIGDVDIMICKETPQLSDLHITHLKNNILPYSNSIRSKQKRFTGLHFFKVDEYYEKMSNIIKEYSINIKNKNLVLSQRYRNEHLLFDIIKKGIGKLPKDEFRIDIGGSGPHHGLHLGIWRGYKNNLPPSVKNQIFKDNYKNHYEFYCKIKNDNIFKEIKTIYPLIELKYMENFFNLIK
jgi:hypothetical protein